jgi:hypothetical protein
MTARFDVITVGVERLEVSPFQFAGIAPIATPNGRAFCSRVRQLR